MNSILSAVVAATLALSAIEADAQATPGERQVSLTIESTSLATALDKWAQQSGFQIFVQDWEATKNITAPSLKGTFGAQAALEQLLQGTPLTYVWLNDKAVSIRKKAPQTLPAALQRTGLEGQQPVPVAKFSGDGVVGGATASFASSEGTGGGEPSSRLEQLEEIIVTGTYIRGAAPVGSSVKLYSREQIERSGAGTIAQFARTMSENFSNLDGVANASSSNRYVRLNNDASASNAFAGESFNIHGVGSAATLTLVDGRRLAPAGLGGAMTDISLIPLSAVERIEVMPDGASAIYGADAVAGVVNIVTRHDFEGAETRMRYGNSSDGGGRELMAAQLLGASWDTGNAFIGYEYGKQDALDASERDYLPDQGGPYSLMPENQRDSVFLSARQALGESTVLRAQGTYSDRSFSSEATTNSLVTFSRSAPSGNVEQASANLAVEHSFANGWIAELGGSYADLRQTAADVQSITVPFTATLTNRSRADADTFGFDVLLSGRLMDLPGGAIRMALGGSFRNETFKTERITSIFGTTSVLTVPKADRDVTSFHGEILLPLVGNDNAVPGVRRLQLSLAGRFDDYSDFGSSSNPKVGLAWEPIEHLRLRSSYGTSFKTPLLAQSNTPQDYVATIFPDSQSGVGFANALLIQGGNPALGPEEAESFTAGVDWRPMGEAGLVLSATYFDLRFTDRVARPPSAGLFDLGDPQLTPFIVRNPPLADVQRYFDDPAFFGDFTGGGPGGIGAIFDNRYANIAVTSQSGVDLTTGYNFVVGLGALTVALNATRLFENKLQSAESGPELNLLNAFGQPLKWKGRASVAWSREPFAAVVSVNYANSYDNTLFAPAEAIDSWTTGDLNFSYSTGEAAPGLLDNLNIGLSITNVTDERPPTVGFPPQNILPGEQPISFDAANSSPVGRFFSLLITKRW